jgi:hypothetical protein
MRGSMTLNRPDSSAVRSRLFAAYNRLGPYRRAITAALAVVFVLLMVAGVQATRFAAGVLIGLPHRAELRDMGRMAQATTIFDRAGNPAFSLSREQRIEVPHSDDLAAPDPGGDFDRGPAVLRAPRVRPGARHRAASNIREGRAAQGGSTITQQLARQSFLSPTRRIQRKLREVVLANHIERLFSKDEILELYLNKVYFGDGLYGVEAASRGYFGRQATDISLTRRPLAAGLIQSPSSYAPTVNLERAVARRNVVLQAMLESGDRRGRLRHGPEEAPVLENALRRESPSGSTSRNRSGGNWSIASDRQALPGRPAGLHHDGLRPAAAGRAARREGARGDRGAANRKDPG